MAFDKAKTLRAAEKYLEVGKIPAAIKEYCKIVESEPEDFTTLNMLGDLYARVGDQTAVDSRKLHDGHADIHVELARHIDHAVADDGRAAGRVSAVADPGPAAVAMSDHSRLSGAHDAVKGRV